MSVLTTQNARYMILTLELPGAGRMNAGVLLEDPATDRLWVRLRRGELDSVERRFQSVRATLKLLSLVGRQFRFDCP